MFRVIMTSWFLAVRTMRACAQGGSGGPGGGLHPLQGSRGVWGAARRPILEKKINSQTPAASIEKVFSGKFKFWKEPLNFSGTRETLAKVSMCHSKVISSHFLHPKSNIKNQNFTKITKNHARTHSENP